MGPNKVPYIVTNDARTLRYPHPDIAVHDTVKLELGTNKVLEHLKFEIGNFIFFSAEVRLILNLKAIWHTSPEGTTLGE